MIRIQENVPLAQYTTFSIGGPARFFVEVKSADELREALVYAKKKNLDFFILGGGSNLLVSDSGFPGLVIKMKLGELKIEGEAIKAEVGVPLAKLVRDSAVSGLAGLEWAAGIPGSLGGAIRGNAGAYEGEIKDVIKSVTVLETGKMEIRQYKAEDCNFQYRNSLFKKDSTQVIISAQLKLAKGNKEESLKKMQDILAKRTARQPQGPSAGSFFMNPDVSNEKLQKEYEIEHGARYGKGKLPAAWLIVHVDLKGKRVGKAMISNIHPNFIVNTGGATAHDVIILSSLVKQKIRAQFGIQLKEEVQFIGF